MRYQQQKCQSIIWPIFPKKLYEILAQGEHKMCPLADPEFGQGGAPEFFPRFCWRSEAELGEQSEQILAGVQGPP